MYDLITIGDSTLDTFLVIEDAQIRTGKDRTEHQLCLNYADKIPISHSIQSVGGNAANVTAGTRKLGLKNAIVTELGNDINGHEIKNALGKARVDTRFVKLNKNQETRYAVVLNFKSERTILSIYPKRKYDLPKLPKTKWVYFTSMGPGFEKVQKKLVTYLKKNKSTKLAINPGSYQIKNKMSVIKQLFPFTEIIIVNKEEAEKLVGKKLAIKLLLKSLYKKGIKQVVITDSLKGSFSYDGKKMLHMKIYPHKPIAKTGAGDAYTSGLLAAIIQGKELAKGMQWGSANAAGVVQQFGAQKGLQTKAQVEKTIKKYKEIRPKNF